MNILKNIKKWVVGKLLIHKAKQAISVCDDQLCELKETHADDIIDIEAHIRHAENAGRDPSILRVSLQDAKKDRHSDLQEIEEVKLQERIKLIKLRNKLNALAADDSR